MSQQAVLRARREAVIADARAIMNKKPGALTASDDKRFDELMAQADALSRELQFFDLTPSHQRLHNGLGATAAGRGKAEDPEVRAFTNYLKHGLAGLSPDDKEIMMSRYSPGIQGAQGVGSGGAGGFAVPDAPMHELVEAMKLIGGVLPFATIVPSQSGAPLPIPTDNETAVEGEIINENQAANEGDITLASVTLDSFLYHSKIVRVSIQLLDDSGFDFGAYVIKKLGQRIGRITARHWVVGDGSSKPRGVNVAAPVGKVAASATAITYDEILDLFHSVDGVYRANGTWLVSDTTFAAFRKLKDGQQRPLYGDLSSSAPNMLLGRPVSIDPNMPAMTTGQKSVIFGDLSNYFVRFVKDVRVMRLEERYAEFAQLGFMAFLRADGDLVDGGGGAVKALQMA